MSEQEELFQLPEEKPITGVVEKSGKYIAVIVIEGVGFELKSFNSKYDASDLLEKAELFKARGWSGKKLQQGFRK